MFRRHIRPRSSRLVERRRRLLLFRFGGALALVGILVGLLWWGATRPALQIQDIAVSGNEVVTADEIKSIAGRVLSGTYFFLFPKSNTLWYPQGDIEATILSSFERLKEVSVSRENLTGISITVAERSPASLWCRELGNVTCYFLNDEGLIFAKAPDFTGNVFFRFYGGIEASDPIGKTYLQEHEEFSRAIGFIEALRGVGLLPIELRVVNGEDMELIMEDGTRVLISRNRDFSETFENLKIVLDSETFKKRAGLDIDYLDLRFGNKIYFKLQ
ncbi:hypothetical protein A3D62_02235 [Candidatus Kaiserbacteria bacterium RIFCSPHIGHO2_02_FULL_49_11]|uniref:POTRA domain-containing protein n=1 Tax=Candidatus Kaiserbacteria bacterium RIFCSPHIGHO2_02_FULL_49_11 TaxID=1798489 RepID=A0A1F6D077_9BACT|nr:MAG: hypothetical protein A3D62_02235 [Candidatus Kaiserbacteria bacterium RIFCSPHIGHO2_02_FULL_49_11]